MCASVIKRKSQIIDAVHSKGSRSNNANNNKILKSMSNNSTNTCDVTSASNNNKTRQIIHSNNIRYNKNTNNSSKNTNNSSKNTNNMHNPLTNRRRRCCSRERLWLFALCLCALFGAQHAAAAAAAASTEVTDDSIHIRDVRADISSGSNNNNNNSDDIIEKAINALAAATSAGKTAHPTVTKCFVNIDGSQETREIGAVWSSVQDACAIHSCELDESAGVPRETVTKVDCGQFYCDVDSELRPQPGSCCGECVRNKCRFNDTVYDLGKIWHSPDGCTMYECGALQDSIIPTPMVNVFEKSCAPLPADCPASQVYTKGCCQYCRRNNALSKHRAAFLSDDGFKEIWTEEFYRQHPCVRECKPNAAPMTCTYTFVVEWYETMSKACYECPQNGTDCQRPHCVLADGIERSVMVVNRMMPGPSIEVCEGDTIVVDVENHLLGDSTTIHWHGMHQHENPYMDGVPHITQCPISPHSTFRYRFKAENVGTHFWHSHTGMQRGDGVFGALIVRRPRVSEAHGHLYDFDLPEHKMILQDWVHSPGVSIFASHHHSRGDNKPVNLLVNGRGRFYYAIWDQAKKEAQARGVSGATAGAKPSINQRVAKKPKSQTPPQARAQPKLQPQPSSQPQPKLKPQPSLQPQPKLQPQPSSQPQPRPQPQPQATPQTPAPIYVTPQTDAPPLAAEFSPPRSQIDWLHPLNDTSYNIMRLRESNEVLRLARVARENFTSTANEAEVNSSHNNTSTGTSNSNTGTSNSNAGTLNANTGTFKANTSTINTSTTSHRSKRAVGEISLQQMPLQTFHVHHGFRYRFRIINAEFLNCPIAVSIDNHTLIAINSDGYDFEALEVGAIVTYAGERFDFVLNANQSIGNYWIRFKGLMDCSEEFTSAFQVGILRYESAPDEEPAGELGWHHKAEGIELNAMNQGSGHPGFLTAAEMTGLSLYDKIPGVGREALKDEADYKFFVYYDFYAKDNPEFHPSEYYSFQDSLGRENKVLTPQLNHITLKFPPMALLPDRNELDDSMFCNETSLAEQGIDCRKEFCKCYHVLQVPLNATVELILVDEGFAYDANHPFHLHGNAFRVVGLERLGRNVTIDMIKQLDSYNLLKRNLDKPPVKDTVTVPDGGYTIIRFQAYNPGYWLFHCHIEFHAEIGMAVILKVGENHEMKSAPKNFPTCHDFMPRDGEEQDIEMLTSSTSLPMGGEQSGGSSQLTASWLLFSLAILSLSHLRFLSGNAVA